MSIKRFLIVVPVVRHCQSINSVRQKDYHKSFWKCTSLYTYRKPEANSGKSDKKCTRCGRSHHPRHQCPARNAICHSCNRKGHFKSQYFSKTNSKSVVQIIHRSRSNSHCSSYVEVACLSQINRRLYGADRKPLQVLCEL